MHADEPPGQASEAARYAVLRRIGPALRHDLVVNLQAVAMMSEVLTARLERGLLPLADLQHHLARIQRGTREAVANSLRVASWLAPPEDDRIDLAGGIQECLGLVRRELEYRGFPVRADLPAPGFEVSRAALRPLLLSALIHLSDRARTPGELAVSARTDARHATLTLARLPAGAGAAFDPEAADIPYRPIGAGDVQALAAAGVADLQWQPDRLDIRLPRLVPSTPLKIAPT